MPVLDPVALTTSPRIVNNPIVIPPRLAAVGMYLFKTEYTDSLRYEGKVSCCYRICFAIPRGVSLEI